MITSAQNNSCVNICNTVYIVSTYQFVHIFGFASQDTKKSRSSYIGRWTFFGHKKIQGTKTPILNILTFFYGEVITNNLHKGFVTDMYAFAIQ